MKLLYLGPDCVKITKYLEDLGHSVVHQVDSFSHDFLLKHKFDFAISYKYRHIIKEPEIAFFGGNIINLHISYLPWNRGADPNFWSYIDNTPRGVTIHELEAGLDTGAIILQQLVDISTEYDTLLTSYEKLSRSIEDLFIANAENILSNNMPKANQAFGGSFHHAKDRAKYDYLLKDYGWDTPVSKLIQRM